VELSDEIKDPWGNAKRGVTATARLDRREFGLTWNAALETGGVVVGDHVDVTIEAELVRA
jgi:polyisoprenoid-binding protein YceI